MRRLLFFTQNYPFENGETFIENEIEYLANAFDEVVILPWIGGGEQTREVPSNCTVLSPMLKNDLDTVISGIFSLAPLWYFIKRYFSEGAYRSFSKTFKYISVTIFCRAILSNKSFKQVNESFKDDIIYFYWGLGTAYLLPFIKNRSAKIVRFHGADLYLEVRKNRYLPFRKEVYSNLTTAVFISQQGMNYAKRHFSQYQFNSVVSYLGTKYYGINPPREKGAPFHIVSCSNVIPVKRVHLILEAIRSISDFEIKWTHIGSGSGLDKLRSMCREVAPNLHIEIVGQRSNQEVIEFYRTEHIDLFINVSKSEGVPVSIMEAISFNIPVIATRVGGVPEIVVESVGKLINVNFQPEELAQEIIAIRGEIASFTPYKHWEKQFSASVNYSKFVSILLSDL